MFFARTDVQILNPLSGNGFGTIRAFYVCDFQNARMRTLRLKYFGAIWEGTKRKKPVKSTFYRLLSDLSSYSADRTGLEPATSAVTGRHSNQLNYRSKKQALLLI